MNCDNFFFLRCVGFGNPDMQVVGRRGQFWSTSFVSVPGQFTSASALVRVTSVYGGWHWSAVLPAVPRRWVVSRVPIPSVRNTWLWIVKRQLLSIKPYRVEWPRLIDNQPSHRETFPPTLHKTSSSQYRPNSTLIYFVYYLVQKKRVCLLSFFLFFFAQTPNFTGLKM